MEFYISKIEGESEVPKLLCKAGGDGGVRLCGELVQHRTGNIQESQIVHIIFERPMSSQSWKVKIISNTQYSCPYLKYSKFIFKDEN